jgi:hypothetical protein
VAITDLADEAHNVVLAHWVLDLAGGLELGGKLLQAGRVSEKDVMVDP